MVSDHRMQDKLLVGLMYGMGLRVSEVARLRFRDFDFDRKLVGSYQGFWTGGPAAYADGLRKHYEPQLADLRKSRQDADETKRAELDAEIERVETEYKSKFDSIDDCLF